MAEYIEREGAYPLAKKICDAIDSKEFQRLNFGMRILDWIDDIPAADVRPITRGKWLDKWCEDNEIISGGFWIKECSNCHEDMYYGEPYFCPNCGAKMEES